MINLRISICSIFISVLLCIGSSVNTIAQINDDHNIIWNSPSKHSGESMPCGGGDIGMNVWVENGDLLFYFSRSGSFDENNTLLKSGRIRIKLDPNPFEGDFFRQELKLQEGCIEINARNNALTTSIRLWSDVYNPVINVDIQNNQALKTEVYYENWRYEDRSLVKNESNQNSYKWAAPAELKTLKDNIGYDDNSILFYHRNDKQTVFDASVKQQGLESVKNQLFNPLENLIFGGKISASNLKLAETGHGNYANTEFKSWKLESKKNIKKCDLRIYLHTCRTEAVSQWKNNLNELVRLYDKENSNKLRKKNIEWWKSFWNRSFIVINPDNKNDTSFQIGRNYQLFRYMLACNAYGNYPTKFNGGLFTYDPCYIDTTFSFTPDFRKWGGGTHTAQNQRLVYFPMLKSGDFDMMKPQFDFYNGLLLNAELRSKVYWGHEGACFTEQIENFGLPNPSEYGWKRPESFDKGLEYNAWLEYQWDTVLEFCLMILETERYTGKPISEYLPLIESCLRFFDEHYQYLANQRGRKTLDGNNKLILYPGSACETYKMATNATSTIAALKIISEKILELNDAYLDDSKKTYFRELHERISEIRTRNIDGYETIAPAWLWERENNTESPQLYPVFPWRIYGVGKPELEIARNTWKYDPDVIKFRSHIGWKQDAIWAACLGLSKEARELVSKKLRDSGRRFPAFWGPGFDWTPDHNWGGSGMIALQEMLMQIDGQSIILLPAWPMEWDVHFRLHAPFNTIIECKVKNGKIDVLNVTPENRRKDLIILNGK